MLCISTLASPAASSASAELAATTAATCSKKPTGSRPGQGVHDEPGADRARGELQRRSSARRWSAPHGADVARPGRRQGARRRRHPARPATRGRGRSATRRAGVVARSPTSSSGARCASSGAGFFARSWRKKAFCAAAGSRRRAGGGTVIEVLVVRLAQTCGIICAIHQYYQSIKPTPRSPLSMRQALADVPPLKLDVNELSYSAFMTAPLWRCPPPRSALAARARLGEVWCARRRRPAACATPVTS